MAEDRRRTALHLKMASSRGSEILIGDPFRTYLPLGELDLLTTYHVPVSRDLEDREIRRTSVFRLRTGEIASGADS